MSSYKIRKTNRKKLENAFIKIYREESLVKNDSKCVYCREPLTYRCVTADHVTPKSEGGLNQKENIVASCRDCNQAKASMPKGKFTKLLNSPFPSGQPVSIMMAWSRRRINLQTERSCKKILASVGRKE